MNKNSLFALLFILSGISVFGSDVPSAVVVAAGAQADVANQSFQAQLDKLSQKLSKEKKKRKRDRGKRRVLKLQLRALEEKSYRDALKNHELALEAWNRVNALREVVSGPFPEHKGGLELRADQGSRGIRDLEVALFNAGSKCKRTVDSCLKRVEVLEEHNKQSKKVRKRKKASAGSKASQKKK